MSGHKNPMNPIKTSRQVALGALVDPRKSVAELPKTP
jgi:hypothetical protein